MKSRKQMRVSNKGHRQELLDEALEETFPASDPPAMLEPAPRQKRPPRKKAKRRARR